MLPVLDTVEEVLTFYAEFGLPLSMTKSEKEERVQNVMDLMALNHIQRTFVGGQLGAGISVRGVSGGEKRRVSIGCALLKNPAVVVLDEPTSGLDSSKASEVRPLLPTSSHTAFSCCRPTHGNNVVDASPHVRVKLLGLRAKVRVTWVRVRGKGLTLTLTLSLSPNPYPNPGESIDRMHCFAP